MSLKLNKNLPKAKTPHEQESLKRTIAATDTQIAALVYELYGLTEAEIHIVECRASSGRSFCWASDTVPARPFTWQRTWRRCDTDERST